LTASKLDEIDKKLLQLAQDEFPITRRPWAALGNKLKITEEEVMSRLKRLHREGIIRKIGPILDARKLGLCASTLIAMKVPEEKLESVVDIINEYKSVSHNYLREHEYNLWFTITTSSKEELRRTVEEIKRRTEIPDTDVLDLSTSRRFKIDVRFQFT
jgi:DNA-binding Lrp family transcriptional regulator